MRRQALENLTDYCAREGVPAFLFFEHFRGDAVEVIGGGGAAAAFLALPNHREAQEAVAFIGSDHRWVEAQHTRGVNTTVTDTWGHSSGYTDGGMSSSSNVSESFSHALGKTEEYSTTEQRVFEPLVEPNVIMGLPATGMIYVEVQPGGQRRIANVDFNPQIAFSPRVSEHPFELAATTSIGQWAIPDSARA